MAERPVIVVGAGIAGVACARELVAEGVPVQVRERSQIPAGRMATQLLDGRPVDIGAAYFTVSDPSFEALVSDWRSRNLVRPWTDTLLVHDTQGWRTTQGPMRWTALCGLRSLVADLAADVPVQYESPVAAVGPGPTVDGSPASAVALAMPDTQAALLVSDDLEALHSVVAEVEWAPVLTVVVAFDHRSWESFPAAFVNDHPVLSLVCDDGDRHGDGAPVLVVHTTAGFAAEHLEQPRAAVPDVLAALHELWPLPEQPRWSFAHRWRYARPREARQRRFEFDPHGVALAGDGWGPPRVQTAWLSGRDLGRHLVARL